MNRFKQLMHAAGGHPPVGTWVMSASPVVAEAIGCAGFDWVLVDMEHAPVDTMGLVHLLQALGCSKSVPVVRVPWNDPVIVKRTLDAGATTLMFPYVQTDEEAVRAVASTRFPPDGIRGMAGMSRGSRFGTAPNYLKTANQHVGVIVQIETREAVDRLGAIAAVPGVDALFIGPADLSGSLGVPGELMHAKVLDQMTRAVQRCKDAGKPIGTLGLTPQQVAQYRAIGFDFVAIGADLAFVMQGAAAAINALRTPDAEHVHSLNDGTRSTAPG